MPQSTLSNMGCGDAVREIWIGQIIIYLECVIIYEIYSCIYNPKNMNKWKINYNHNKIILRLGINKIR